jgi:hypothetical protein
LDLEEKTRAKTEAFETNLNNNYEYQYW